MKKEFHISRLDDNTFLLTYYHQDNVSNQTASARTFDEVLKKFQYYIEYGYVQYFFDESKKESK